MTPPPTPQPSPLPTVLPTAAPTPLPTPSPSPQPSGETRVTLALTLRLIGLSCESYGNMEEAVLNKALVQAISGVNVASFDDHACTAAYGRSRRGRRALKAFGGATITTLIAIDEAQVTGGMRFQLSSLAPPGNPALITVSCLAARRRRVRKCQRRSGNGCRDGCARLVDFILGSRGWGLNIRRRER